MTMAIAVTGLRKSFGDKVVLDGIDLNVAQGCPRFVIMARTPRHPEKARQAP